MTAEADLWCAQPCCWLLGSLGHVNRPIKPRINETKKSCWQPQRTAMKFLLKSNVANLLPLPSEGEKHIGAVHSSVCRAQHTQIVFEQTVGEIWGYMHLIIQKSGKSPESYINCINGQTQAAAAALNKTHFAKKQLETEIRDVMNYVLACSIILGFLKKKDLITDNDNPKVNFS